MIYKLPAFCLRCTKQKYIFKLLTQSTSLEDQSIHSWFECICILQGLLAADISSGSQSTCVVFTNNQIKCWGKVMCMPVYFCAWSEYFGNEVCLFLQRYYGLLGYGDDISELAHVLWYDVLWTKAYHLKPRCVVKQPCLSCDWVAHVSHLILEALMKQVEVPLQVEWGMDYHL